MVGPSRYAFDGLSMTGLHITNNMNGQNRSDIYPGLEVDIILKKDQRTGTLTRGIVDRLLTSAAYHSRGIKVRLEDGQIGRVAHIVDEE